MTCFIICEIAQTTYEVLTPQCHSSLGDGASSVREGRRTLLRISTLSSTMSSTMSAADVTLSNHPRWDASLASLLERAQRRSTRVGVVVGPCQMNTPVDRQTLVECRAIPGVKSLHRAPAHPRKNRSETVGCPWRSQRTASTSNAPPLHQCAQQWTAAEAIPLRCHPKVVAV